MGKSSGFVGGDDCAVSWRPYVYTFNSSNFTDKQERGLLVCTIHDYLVDYGIVKPNPDDIPDLCPKGEQDEAEQSDEVERPPEADDADGPQHDGD